MNHRFKLLPFPQFSGVNKKLKYQPPCPENSKPERNFPAKWIFCEILRCGQTEHSH